MLTAPRRDLRFSVSCFLALFLSASLSCLAVDKGSKPDRDSPIEAYEPNRLGYTWQDDDVPYVDFTVSLKYQLFRALTARLTCGKPPVPEDCRDQQHWEAYLAFTGRFGFYVRTRPSDPVILRNYTPKLLLRYTPDPASPGILSSYLDFAYAHESNGQTTADPARYRFEQRVSERPEFALDEVSRGWDYFQIAGKKTLLTKQEHSIAGYLDLRFFMPDGFIQGTPEEYHDWENDPDGRPRREFHGVLAAAEYNWRRDFGSGYLLADPRFLIQYETGYDPAFRFHTIRAETGARVFDFPVGIWVERGYGHGLARYYKRDTAYGFEFRFAE
jgi:hypothetical protein